MVLPKVAHSFRRRTLFITLPVHELPSRRGNVPKVPQEGSDRNSSLPGDAARRTRLPSERGMNNRPPLINTAHAHELRLERRQLRSHQSGILFEPGPQSLEVLLHDLLVGRPLPLIAL